MIDILPRKNNAADLRKNLNIAAIKLLKTGGAESAKFP
jgi:hypothetical protein